MNKNNTFHIFLNEISKMSTAVFFVVGLAFVSICGTLLEQNLMNSEYESALGVFWFSVFSKLGLFNVFETWWFLAVLAFTMVSVCVCLYRNSLPMWRVFKNKKVPSKNQFTMWDKVEHAFSFEQIIKKVSAAGYKKLNETNDVIYFARGRLNRLGYHFMHIGLVVLMVAGLLTGFAGFRDLVVLANGMETNKVFAREPDGSLTPRALPFTLKNERFELTTYSTGMPSQFATHIEVKYENEKFEKHLVEVNKPVQVGNYMVYQSSYGDAGSLVNANIVFLGKNSDVSNTLNANVNKEVVLEEGYSVTITEMAEHSVEPVASESVVDVVENRGPYMDYIVTSPTSAPYKLRSYMLHPEIIAVVNADGTATPVLLGLPLNETEAWVIVRKLKDVPDENLVDAFAKQADAYLKSLPPEKRAGTALKMLQAVKVVKNFEFPALLHMNGFDKKYYSILQVSTDPGLFAFYVASLLIMIGVILMIYTRYAKMVVVKEKPHTLYVWQDENFTHLIKYSSKE